MTTGLDVLKAKCLQIRDFIFDFSHNTRQLIQKFHPREWCDPVIGNEPNFAGTLFLSLLAHEILWTESVIIYMSLEVIQ